MDDQKEPEIAVAETKPSFISRYGRKILIWGGVAAGVVLGVVLLNRVSDLEDDVDIIMEENGELTIRESTEEPTEE